MINQLQKILASPNEDSWRLAFHLVEQQGFDPALTQAMTNHREKRVLCLEYGFAWLIPQQLSLGKTLAVLLEQRKGKNLLHLRDLYVDLDDCYELKRIMVEEMKLTFDDIVQGIEQLLQEYGTLGRLRKIPFEDTELVVDKLLMELESFSQTFQEIIYIESELVEALGELCHKDHDQSKLSYLLPLTQNFQYHRCVLEQAYWTPLLGEKPRPYHPWLQELLGEVLTLDELPKQDYLLYCIHSAEQSITVLTDKKTQEVYRVKYHEDNLYDFDLVERLEHLITNSPILPIALKNAYQIKQISTMLPWLHLYPNEMKAEVQQSCAIPLACQAEHIGLARLRGMDWVIEAFEKNYFGFFNVFRLYNVETLQITEVTNRVEAIIYTDYLMTQVICYHHAPMSKADVKQYIEGILRENSME